MGLSKTIWSNPGEFLSREHPVGPVLFFAPMVLQTRARRYVDQFPGLVAYPLRANDSDMVLANTAVAGVQAYDAHSLEQIERVSRLARGAVLIDSTPQRSVAHLRQAVALGVRRFRVTSAGDLAGLAGQLPAGAQIVVPLGDGPECEALLRGAQGLGHAVALCLGGLALASDPAAWQGAMGRAAAVADRAGVTLVQLYLGDVALDDRLFAAIDLACAAVFGTNPPGLVCAPGCGVAGEAFAVALGRAEAGHLPGSACVVEIGGYAVICGLAALAVAGDTVATATVMRLAG